VQGSKEVEVRDAFRESCSTRLYNEGISCTKARPSSRSTQSLPDRSPKANAQMAAGARSARNRRGAKPRGSRHSPTEGDQPEREFARCDSAQKLSNAHPPGPPRRICASELNAVLYTGDCALSGVAGRIARSEGSLVSARTGQQLLTDDESGGSIWIRFTFRESDLAKLPDRSVDRIKSAEVRLPSPTARAIRLPAGSIRPATQIDPQACHPGTARGVRQSRRAAPSPASSCGSRWRPGERDKRVLVPQTAVIQTEKSFSGVHLGKETKPNRRPVQVGEWLGSDWVILGAQPRRPRDSRHTAQVRPGA